MTESNAQKVILVDGSSYLFRAFHAIREMNTSSGFPTNAIRGVISMIRKLQKDYTDSKIVVVFDAKGKTFRNDLYSEYKANRPPMPDDLRVQIQPIHDIIKAMGLPLLVINGVEADDVIGTLSKKFKNIREVKIFSGDKDFAQLVDKKTSIINPINLDIVDQKAVKKKFGVEPKNIIDYLALVGDKSDNIPGVPGVGNKTASRLINQYGNVEKIIKQKDLIAGKVGEAIKSNLNQLILSKTLATIKLDVDISIELKDLIKFESNKKDLIKILKELELKTLLKNESENGEKNLEKEVGKKEILTSYNIVTDKKKFLNILEKVKKGKLISFDLETTSLDYINAKIVGISFALNPKNAYYIPIMHEDQTKYKQLPEKLVLEKLKPILENSQIKKLGHNLKYDRNVLCNYKISLEGIDHDSMLLSYVYDSTAIRHGLDS
ncbi:MAG: DNA polymerase I, partial [Bermanella sp.]|nr:DNA polymerase I [Bermanella sp.]